MEAVAAVEVVKRFGDRDNFFKLFPRRIFFDVAIKIFPMDNDRTNKRGGIIRENSLRVEQSPKIFNAVFALDVVFDSVEDSR